MPFNGVQGPKTGDCVSQEQMCLRVCLYEEGNRISEAIVPTIFYKFAILLLAYKTMTQKELGTGFDLNDQHNLAIGYHFVPAVM